MMDKVVVMGDGGVYNEFIEERGVVKMEIKVGSEVRKVSDECEKVVLGVVEKSGKSVEEVLEVVYFMFCFKREGVEGVWDIEWDDCELEMEECVWYERMVMEVCKELDVELKYW